MTIIKFCFFSSLLLIELVNLNLVNFNDWKQQVVSQCEINCKGIKDEFYLKECNYVKNRIEDIDVDIVYDYYSESKKLTNALDVELKYFVYYFSSGEIDESFCFYIYKSNCRKFFIAKVSDLNANIEIAEHRRISKKILSPDCSVTKRSGIADDFGVIVEYRTSKIIDTKIIYNPDADYLDRILKYM